MNIMKQTSSLKRAALSALFLILSSLTLCRGQLTEDLGVYSGVGMSNMACFSVADMDSAQRRVDLYFTLDGRRSIGLFLPGKDIDICKQTLYAVLDEGEVEYPPIPLRELTSPETICPVSYLPGGRYVLKLIVDTSRLMPDTTSSPSPSEVNLCMILFSKPLGSEAVLDVPLYLPADPEPAYGNDPVAGITSSRSYIVTRQMLSETGASYQETVEYFDGLGRPIQTVRKGDTPKGNDLSDFTDYDTRGKVWRQWKPVPVAGFNGAFVNNLPVKARTVCDDTRPYSETGYLVSNPDTPTRSTGMGEKWKNHPTYSIRKTNTQESPFDCIRFTVSTTGLPVSGENWATGELSVIDHQDEDGNRSLVFTDKLGRTVLERNFCDSFQHDTYYVFDYKGDLSCVIPPSINAIYFTEEEFCKYGYAYTYDGLHRLTGKRLPGCGWQHYAYDDADRRIYSRDARQAACGECTFSIPDEQGREAVSGICSLSSSQLPSLTGIVKASFTATGADVAGTGYAFSGISVSPSSLLRVNYYDTYDFLTLPALAAFADSLTYRPASGYDERYTATSAPAVSAFGRLTGSRTYILETGEEILTAYYYDDNGNVVQSRSTNHLGGYDTEVFAYTFTGKVKKQRHIHTAQGKASQTEQYTYEYDHAERPVSVFHSVNGRPSVRLIKHQYDEFCRLSGMSFHNEAHAVNYTYNIRDWMTNVSGGKFSQTLHYTDGPGIPRYNSNISSMTWVAGGTSTLKGYTFTYDGLNRLRDAVYGEGSSLSTNPNRFSEQVTKYDKMGNILGLLRYGRTSSGDYGLLDNLNLTYNGNQLKTVYDNATNSSNGNGMEFKDFSNKSIEYEYDENGNMTKDLNRKITDIRYNCLNLPSRIEFDDGNNISYEYAANGTKLRTIHVIGNDTTKTDYCGNTIYENGIPQTLITKAGYFSLNDNKYHYYLKDHQGNNRVVVNQDGTVEETNDYYPFGGLMASSSNSVQPYKYNGKELDRKGGLDWYDYGARHYDATIGRFTTVDPMSDEYYPLSPYGYCGGNPICHRDEEGKFINNIIGAFIGAAADLGVQVVANVALGKGAFEDIDWVSVGASAVEGGLTSGLSAGKTLAVKTGVAVAKNTINGIKNGDSVSEIAKSTASDVVADKIIGKTSQLVGKGLKSAAPKLEKDLTRAGNKMVLSNNKATKMARNIPGVSDTKTAREVATSKNGLVDASKRVNNMVQKAPENVVNNGMNIAKEIYEKKKKKKKN